MAAALAIFSSLVLPAIKKAIITGIDKLPGEFQPRIDELPGELQQPPRVPGLLHQFPLELRQQVFELTAPLDNRHNDPRSYEPLRVDHLLSSCLYQTYDSVPTGNYVCELTDRQPPIKYKAAYKSLLSINRQTHIDMMSTITTEAVQALQEPENPQSNIGYRLSMRKSRISIKVETNTVIML